MRNREEYDRELREIHDRVRKMGMEVEAAIDKTIHCFNHLDVKLAKEIVSHDDVIDRMEQSIEESCIHIVVKQAPLATDWRVLASYMRMIGDLERIADNCCDIALYVWRLSDKPEVEVPGPFREMFRMMREMVGNTIESFFSGNEKLADGVMQSDESVDFDFRQIEKKVEQSIQKNPKQVGQYLDYLMISKYVERMADHSTNIAAWVKFIVKGKLEMPYTDRYRKAGSEAVFYQG